MRVGGRRASDGSKVAMIEGSSNVHVEDAVEWNAKRQCMRNKVEGDRARGW